MDLAIREKSCREIGGWRGEREQETTLTCALRRREPIIPGKRGEGTRPYTRQERQFSSLENDRGGEVREDSGTERGGRNLF